MPPLANQAIFERGYMLQSEVLDPYSMRPYINHRGLHVVAQVVSYKPLGNCSTACLFLRPLGPHDVLC